MNMCQIQNSLRKNRGPSIAASESVDPRGTITPLREKLEQENRFSPRKQPATLPPASRNPRNPAETIYGVVEQFADVRKPREIEVFSRWRRQRNCHRNVGDPTAPRPRQPRGFDKHRRQPGKRRREWPCLSGAVTRLPPHISPSPQPEEKRLPRPNRRERNIRSRRCPSRSCACPCPGRNSRHTRS